MNFKKEKIDIFSKIASVKIDANSLLSNKTNSFASVDKTKGAVIPFLLDLFKSLEDVNQMKDIIIDSIYRNSEDIELKIKNILIKSLNEMVLCYADPKIPNSYLVSSNTEGFKININHIDYTKLLKINPNSEDGKLLFFDNTLGTNSSDLNTFLYSVILTPNQWYNWKGILSIRYQNNFYYVKINNSYQNKKLSKLFEDIINSIDLFNTKTLLNNLIDSYSATISYKVKKSKSQINNELIVDKIIDKIIDSDEDDVENNSGYFTFTNEDNQDIEDIINSRSNGTFVVETAYESLDEMLSYDSLNQMNTSLDNASQSEIDSVIENALNSLGSIDVLDVSNVDLPILNLNFIETMVKNLGKMFTNTILSPKIMLVFNMAKQLSGDNTDTEITTFIKDNVNIIKMVITTIKNQIIGLILDRCLKLLKEIVFRKIQSIISEKLNNRKKQIRSLIKPI